MDERHIGCQKTYCGRLAKQSAALQESLKERPVALRNRAASLGVSTVKGDIIGVFGENARVRICVAPSVVELLEQGTDSRQIGGVARYGFASGGIMLTRHRCQLLLSWQSLLRRILYFNVSRCQE